jgi:hypothetical protein
VSQPRRPERSSGPDLFARLQSALPLLIVYFALAALYAWQASRRPMPTIFTDELELTQLSRAISQTGEAARRGVPYGLPTLLAYVLAPVWWLGTTSAAYATAKIVLVLAMTATLFPAYALARLVVPPWYALAAAGGSIAVPALAYSPILVEEPLAYPLATLSLWLISRALLMRSWGRLALAVLACAGAALTRTQLAVLFVVLVLALLWLAWQSDEARRWRESWSGWDRVGAVVVLVGIWIVISSGIGHVSASWRNTNAIYKDRIFEHAMWATGALAIGIGILPLLLGLAALARPKSERRDPRTRAFVVTSTAAVVAFIWYAGIKGAYISTVFATIVAERNLIYLCPVLFAGTALALHRGVGRSWAIAAATLFTLYVVPGTPLHLRQYPYYEAHGLEMAAFANRELGWSEGVIKAALWIACVLAFGVVVALQVLRRDSRAFRVVAGGAAGIVVAWSLTTEVYAAKGERHLSTQIASNFGRPYDWVDQITGRKSVVVLGQAITDPTNIWETEFFNRSVKKMWSLDGSAIKVGGPILTPDLKADDGTLTPSPGTQYALALNGIELAAPLVGTRGNNRLYRIDGRALKLASAVTGLESDGWMSAPNATSPATASYTRYDVSRDGPGFAVGQLSRVASCGKDMPGRATVKIGPVGIGPDKQPAIKRVTAVWPTKAQAAHGDEIVHQCKATGFAIPVPTVPWRLEISITPTFVPRELDPQRFSDARHLGAVLKNVRFQPLFGG